jgi:hypothetical protein
MGEFALVLVTPGADFQAIALEHGHIVASVRIMTIHALIDAAAVLEWAVLEPVNGGAVTGGAHLFLPGSQQPFFITGMWTVAVHASIAVTLGQMGMGGQHLVEGLGVALLAFLNANPAR